MKGIYEIPSIEIVMLQTAEVITASGQGSGLSQKVPQPNTEAGWGPIT